MNVHFIAIGGAAMHNLAIALHQKGDRVSGSDSEIFEPSRGRLKSHGLLPDSIEWKAEHIHDGLDAVILGMKAKADNPELLRAQELGIPIFSYPEFLYEQAKDKRRIVIAGSHGKTTITSIILHVCKKAKLDVDYMVGAQLEGYETMVRISHAKTMILEGDEYLSSPLDLRSKFVHYRPHVALLSGIAWDHINVFPKYPEYLACFEDLLKVIEPGGKLIYCEEDAEVLSLVHNKGAALNTQAYRTPEYSVSDGHYLVDGKHSLSLVGKHNMQNLEAACAICIELGLSRDEFYDAVADFEGASRRLEIFRKSDERLIYRDFAHSPSKLKATVEAVKEQYPDRTLMACIELHTYSSLNKNFLPEYAHSLDHADKAVVFYSPKTIANKGLESIEPNDILSGFSNPNIQVIIDVNDLKACFEDFNRQAGNILLMSSGNFGGLNLDEIFN